VDTLTFRTFVLLTLFVSGVSLFSLVSHNSWAVWILLWFVVHAIVYLSIARLKAQPKTLKRIRWIWAVVSMILAAVFVSQFRPPLTSIVVTVKDAPAPSQLQLATVTLDADDKESISQASRVFPSVRATAGTSKATFILIRPIKEDIQRLELRFGDHPYDWTLGSIDVGSDFARIPIPIASWTGTEVIESRYMKPLMTQMTPHAGTGHATLKADANDLRRAKRPAIRLNLSRAIVVKQAAEASYELLRAGWLAIALLALLLALWLPKIFRAVKQVTARIPNTALLRYLNSSADKPRA